MKSVPANHEFPCNGAIPSPGQAKAWYGAILPALLKRHGCHSYWGFPLPFIKVPGIWYVTSVMDVYFLLLPRIEQWSWRRRMRSWPQWLLSYWATWRTIQVADHVVVISQATGKDLQHFFHLKTWEMVPPAPDITPDTATDPPAKPDHPYILAVGGFQPFRNRERLIRAYAQASSRQTSVVRLVIVGQFANSQQHAEYVSLCRQLGVAGQVDFVTDADDGQLAKWYRNAQGLIHPTLCEGFGMPVVEALAFGKAVAVSTAGAAPEAAGGWEVMQFHPHDVEQMAEALAVLWNAAPSAPAVVQARQAYARSFSWETSADITAKLLISPDKRNGSGHQQLGRR